MHIKFVLNCLNEVKLQNFIMFNKITPFTILCFSVPLRNKLVSCFIHTCLDTHVKIFNSNTIFLTLQNIFNCQL